MNFGGMRQAPAAPSPDAMEMNKLMFEMEMNLRSDIFSSMLDSCRVKCIPAKYHDAMLNTGEAVCIDRCVKKYLAVVELLNKQMQDMQQQQQQQQS